MAKPYPAVRKTSRPVALARAALALGALACLCACAGTPASAYERIAPIASDIEIVDRTEGRVLPIYMHEGRRYVVGRPGNEYAIRVTNPRGGRMLAVMSVDGVNVITGDTASTRQSGYVLDPYQSEEISGWRKNMSRTAAFYFTALPDSYAARTGRPNNVGVIGVALFRERVAIAPPVVPDKREARPSGDAAGEPSNAARAMGSMQAAPAAPAFREEDKSRLGTGHGRIESSYASYTSFERASSTPDETLTIYYDSYENLLAQGVPVGPPIASARPNPFPERARFVPDPR